MLQRRRWPWLRYTLTVISAGVLAFLFWPLVGEVRGAAELLRTARWPWLGAAALLEIGGYACLAALNQGLLRPFPGRIGLGRMMAVLPAIAFIEVAVPSAGASGVVLRGRLLGQRGYSPEVSTFTLALENLYQLGVRSVILLAGIWFLLAHGELSVRQLVGLALALGLTLGLLGGLWGLIREPARAEARLVPLLRVWNALAHRVQRPPQSIELLRPRLHAFYHGLAQLRQMPLGWFGFATAGHVAFDIAALGACFMAFAHPLDPGTLLTGYSLTLLVSGLAALPGGLVLTEASLAVIFNRLSVPGEVALAAALVYRLIAFWLLRLIGFICWQALEAEHEKRRANSPTI